MLGGRNRWINVWAVCLNCKKYLMERLECLWLVSVGILTEVGLLMALGISKEEPICVCYGNAERGVFMYYR